MNDDSSEESTQENSDDTSSEPKDHRLFTFHLVNSYGSTEVGTIRDDDRPLQFSSGSRRTAHPVCSVPNAAYFVFQIAPTWLLTGYLVPRTCSTTRKQLRNLRWMKA